MPTLTSKPRTEITVPKSASYHESEGLAVRDAGLWRSPLGGVLDWQMLPELTPTTFFTRIASYLPTPAPSVGRRKRAARPTIGERAKRPQA